MRRRAPLGLLGAWFFVVLAPTSSFIPIVTEVAAERRMYLPLAAPVTLIVVVAYLLAEASALRARPRLRPTISAIRTALAAGAVAVLVWTTRQRNEVYRSPLAIWRDAVDAVPDNHRARTNLGIALVLEGRLDGAIAQFQEALEISPRSARPHYNLGNTLASQGRLDEAIEHYRATISARPLTAEAHYNLGVALGQQGKLEEAAASFRVAIDLRPGDADARYHLAVALRGLGARREAIGEARRAVEIQPDHAGAQSLLDVLLSD